MMRMIPLFGVLGGVCFAVCGVPLAWSTVRAGRSLGPGLWTPMLIAAGGVSMYLYLLLTYGFNALLALNYAVEVGSWAVVLWYYLFRRTSA